MENRSFPVGLDDQPLIAETILEQTYAYVFEITLAALATDTAQIQIDASSDFYWLKTAYFASVAGAAQTDSTRVIPLVTWQLTDTGSAREYFQQPVPVPSVAGVGELPFILPMGTILGKQTLLKSTFTSFEAVDTIDLKIALIGFKNYERGSTFR